MNRKSGLLLGLMLLVTGGLMAQSVSIIPLPVSVQPNPGVFVVDGAVGLLAPSNNKAAADVVRYFSKYIEQVSGVKLPLTGGAAKKRQIRFVLAPTKGVGEEGYQLSVTSSGVVVQANEARGLFYGVQSLLQTLPAIRTNQVLQIPCMEVTDYPRFKWRGMMLDVSRHFFSPELVKEFIDLLAAYKMNVFHWHLVDGAGWRIEIKQYPLLTTQAAWRVDDGGKTWNWADVQFNADRSKATYGGFYTQQQIKEIVAYAASKHITVVPEIEMPGHSEAAMAAYPQYSCTPKNTFAQAGNFSARDVQANYCAGNDSAFVFLQNVLAEVLALFPSKYIHIGGDEVDKSSWKVCAKCQRRKQVEGLKDEEELQSYFIRRMEKYLVSKGRRMIGWDEILEGGLAPQATVMSWRGEEGGIKAAQMNHDVVMSPGTPCYFDHYQGDPETEPKAFGGFNTLKKVYHYEPVPAALDSKAATHVLGAQANLWTEYIPGHEQVEYMILPRMPALAEVLWSPRAARNWKGFNERLAAHLVGFEQRGLHYSKGNFKVDIKPQVNNGRVLVQLGTEREDGTIYYTTDGSEPGTGSDRYTAPFEIDRSTTLKAAIAVNNSMAANKPAQQSFTFNKATGKQVSYATPNSRYYQANGPATLIDALRGTKEIGQQWDGFNGNDLVATVDLGAPVTAQTASLGCLQHYDQWIFFPQWVKFETSTDGITYTTIATVDNTVPVSDRAGQTKDFSARFAPATFRYLRVTAKNLGVCPPGHPGALQNAWLFCDEIVVE